MRSQMKLRPTFPFVASLVAICSNWALRWYSYVFLRLLPFGSRYFSNIGTAAALYVGSTWYLARSPGSPASRFAILRSLATGIYDSSTKPISLLNLAINLLCVLGGLDFVYRAHYLCEVHDLVFCRTGETTSTTAKLICRNPNSASTSLSVCDSSKNCREVSSEGGSDHTVIFEVSGLAPREQYTYTASNGCAGSLATSRVLEEMERFSILSSSCMKPNWPYNPFNHALRIQGLEHVDSYLSTSMKDPEMMLFLGDFIYSDLPAQLDLYTTEYYTKLYRQIYSSPSWTQGLRDLPWLHMFDDHEIVNDYAPSRQDDDLYGEAMIPFHHYQMIANPAGIDKTERSYFTFNLGRVSFFVLDNRSYRSPQPARTRENSTAGWGDRTMLGARQMHHLRTWAAEEGDKEERLLVVVSGVPFTRNWSKGGDEFDSWAGYLTEREAILSLLWDRGGGMIISGDRHEHATTLLPPPLGSRFPSNHAVIEFSTSPLSFFHQPWKREYQAHLPSDVPIHTEWEGMSRFGVFDFDVTHSHARVNFTLVVDGQEDWSMVWQKGQSPLLEKL